MPTSRPFGRGGSGSRGTLRSRAPSVRDGSRRAARGRPRRRPTRCARPARFCEHRLRPGSRGDLGRCPSGAPRWCGAARRSRAAGHRSSGGSRSGRACVPGAPPGVTDSASRVSAGPAGALPARRGSPVRRESLPAWGAPLSRWDVPDPSRPRSERPDPPVRSPARPVAALSPRRPPAASGKPRGSARLPVPAGRGGLRPRLLRWLSRRNDPNADPARRRHLHSGRETRAARRSSARSAVSTAAAL